MKTFLWTTLFWILAAIAGLICLGFGNIPGTPIVDNTWVAKFVPANIDDSIGAAYIANYQCPEVIEPEISEDVENQESQIEKSDSELITTLNTLSDNQGIIYNDMINSFAQLQQMVSDLAVTCSAQADVVSAEPVIDEKEQQRLELQAQIEALQAQMASL